MKNFTASFKIYSHNHTEAIYGPLGQDAYGIIANDKFQDATSHVPLFITSKNREKVRKMKIKFQVLRTNKMKYAPDFTTFHQTHPR